uniref:RING-type domain-containing protein n=1 Tax=Amphilophus citrinellus TaxID=61819 RepID=A0A3Q0QVP2_AMPCI
SASAPPSELCSLQNHLRCSICMDEFTDPVTIFCGHSFCKRCLEQSCDYNDSTCPLCKKYIARVPDVNIVLRDIIQQQKNTQIPLHCYFFFNLKLITIF